MKKLILALTIAALAGPAWANDCLAIREPVPYAQCIVAWENIHVRPRHEFPDLLDRLHTTRLHLAAQLERGQMSAAEADAALKQLYADVYVESRKRIGARYDNVIRHLDAAAARRSIECISIDLGGVATTSCN